MLVCELTLTGESDVFGGEIRAGRQIEPVFRKLFGKDSGGINAEETQRARRLFPMHGDVRANQRAAQRNPILDSRAPAFKTRGLDDDRSLPE